MMKLEPPSPRQVRVLWQRMGHDPDALHPTILDAMLAAERIPAYAPAWRELLGKALTLGGAAPDVAFADADLARLPCPVAFAWGARDPFGGAAFGRNVADKAPGARFTAVGTGHLPWLDDAAGCARAIEPVLTQVARSTA